MVSRDLIRTGGWDAALVRNDGTKVVELAGLLLIPEPKHCVGHTSSDFCKHSGKIQQLDLVHPCHMVKQYLVHYDLRLSEKSLDTKIQGMVSSTMSYDKVKTVAKVLSLVNERTTSSFNCDLGTYKTFQYTW